MKSYYFNDLACDKKGIIRAKSDKDCFVKFINIASQYDKNFIKDMFERLKDAEINFINLDGLKIYE